MRFTHPLVVAALIGFSLVAFAGGDYTTESQKVDQMMAKTKMLPSTTDEARKLRADADRMILFSSVDRSRPGANLDLARV